MKTLKATKIAISVLLPTAYCLLPIFSFAQLSSWQYKVPITIYENSGADLTDYQALLYFDTQAPIFQVKMNIDGSDIRFAEDCRGMNLLNYWVESGIISDSTKIWVKMPSIPASDSVTIFMFYGNPAAASLSSGTNTFGFFDDFDSDPGYTTLGVGSGSYSVSSSIITITETVGAGGLDFGLQLVSSFTVNGDGSQMVMAKFQPTVIKELHCISFIGLNVFQSYKFAGSQAWGLTPEQAYSGSGFQTVYAILDDFSGTGYLALMEDDDATNAAEQKFEWVFVRNYTAPESSTIIGTEEAALPLMAGFTANDACLGDTIQFTWLSGSSPVSWNWDFGDSNNSVQQDPLHFYNATGAYNVELTVADSNDCQATNSMMITINPNPSIAAIIGSDNVKPNEIQIYAVSFTANSKYTWIINGGAQVSGSNSNSIYVLWGAAGLGKVCVIETNSFGCGGDTVCLDVTVASPTAVDELAQLNNSLQIYPNPSKGETTIYYYLLDKSNSVVPGVSTSHSEARIYIYDILGKQVKVYELLKGSHSIILRAAQLNTGVYFITMELDGIIIGREKIIMNKF